MFNEHGVVAGETTRKAVQHVQQVVMEGTKANQRQHLLYTAQQPTSRKAFELCIGHKQPATLTCYTYVRFPGLVF